MFTKGFTVDLCTLNLLRNKETAIIRRIKKTDEKISSQLENMGIIPGLTITLEKRYPNLIVKIGENNLTLSSQIANHIYVKKEG